MLYEAEETTEENVIIEKKPEYDLKSGRICLRCSNTARKTPSGYWCVNCCERVKQGGSK